MTTTTTTIDPATAEVRWQYEQFHHQVGPEYYARNPGGDWVWFGDLPSTITDALWKRSATWSDGPSDHPELPF